MTSKEIVRYSLWQNGEPLSWTHLDFMLGEVVLSTPLTAESLECLLEAAANLLDCELPVFVKHELHCFEVRRELVTCSELTRAERDQLDAICDAALEKYAEFHNGDT